MARKRHRRGGSWRDSVHYSILSSEWPAAKSLPSSPARDGRLLSHRSCRGSILEGVLSLEIVDAISAPEESP